MICSLSHFEKKYEEWFVGQFSGGFLIRELLINPIYTEKPVRPLKSPHALSTPQSKLKEKPAPNTEAQKKEDFRTKRFFGEFKKNEYDKFRTHKKIYSRLCEKNHKREVRGRIQALVETQIRSKASILNSEVFQGFKPSSTSNRRGVESVD